MAVKARRLIPLFHISPAFSSGQVLATEAFQAERVMRNALPGNGDSLHFAIRASLGSLSLMGIWLLW